MSKKTFAEAEDVDPEQQAYAEGFAAGEAVGLRKAWEKFCPMCPAHHLKSCYPKCLGCDHRESVCELIPCEELVDAHIHGSPVAFETCPLLAEGGEK